MKLLLSLALSLSSVAAFGGMQEDGVTYVMQEERLGTVRSVCDLTGPNPKIYLEVDATHRRQRFSCQART